MNWQLICAWLLVIRIPLFFLCTTYQDFNGRPPKKPEGFTGFIGTFLVTLLLAAVYYGAGLFHIIAGVSK